MAIVEGLIIGIFLGLLCRPLLDAYLSWKSAERYRRIDDERRRHRASL